MSISVSWWLLALVVGGSAPFWVRALTLRSERRARSRAERVIAQLNEQSDEQTNEDHDD